MSKTIHFAVPIYNEYLAILLDPERLDAPDCPLQPASVADIRGEPVSNLLLVLLLFWLFSSI